MQARKVVQKCAQCYFSKVVLKPKNFKNISDVFKLLVITYLFSIMSCSICHIWQ